MKQTNAPVKKKRKTGKIKITGNVKYHRGFHSDILKNRRDIVVWLPSSYIEEPERHYPVLYMHDGQNIMDPKTSFAGIDWRVDETLTELIKKNKIQEIIVVGIYNTKERLEEYSTSKKGIKYMSFIVDELKPFIDSEYHTMPGRENTAVLGSSMGGLISFFLVWNYPNIFSKAGCMSSSFYYNEEQVIKMVKNYSGPKKNIKIYIDHGEDGLVRGQKMFCALTKKGYLIGTDIDYYYAPGAQHNEAAWAERLERPLLFFFGKK